jgi:hypothetical protein
MRFDSIRAFSVRIGDKMPAPLSWGGWNRDVVLSVIAIDDDSGLIAFTLEGGAVVRSFPMNTVPFLKGRVA